MELPQLPSGQWVTTGDRFHEVTLADGQVRVHLPLAVDPQALSGLLLREGFPLAHQPDTPDTQGWGDDFDPNGYYPYWVYPDPDHPGRSVFAFNPRPEDVIRAGGADDPRERVSLGERSRQVIERWVPVLERLAADSAAPNNPSIPEASG